MTFLTVILVFLSTILTTIYIWFKYQFSYWKRKNVPHIPPKFFAGSLQDIVMFRESVATALQKLYNDQKTKDEPIVGIHIFHKPGLLIRDSDLIKRILVKDFNYFSNRYSSSDLHSDTLGGYSLFFLKNPIWKPVRSSLSPIFTLARMKQMFYLVDEVGSQLDAYLCSLPIDSKTNTICKDVKDICAAYTIDVISSVAFGVQANSITNPKADFREYGKKIFNFTPYRAIEFTSFFFVPQIVSFFRFKVYPKEASHFLRSILKYVMDEREKSGKERKDLVDVLIKLRRKTRSDNDKSAIQFDGDILVAQAANFFTAGFETSSSTMAFGLYELSKNPHIQDRLREEIKDALEKNNGILTNDILQNMQYLDQVIKETLRMYPSLPFLDRQCILPQGEKGYSLKPYSDFEIPNGMPVYISNFAIHRDEKHFPNPETFDPDRFSPDNKHNIKPNTYIPFGVGPRYCIGENLGIMQSKIGILNFLKNHYVRPSIKSQKEVKLDRKALVLQVEGGIFLDIIRDPLFK